MRQRFYSRFSLCAIWPPIAKPPHMELTRNPAAHVALLPTLPNVSPSDTQADRRAAQHQLCAIKGQFSLCFIITFGEKNIFIFSLRAL